ncbi:conjugative transposon protein TraM [Mucilaginibacter sp. cycad4]|uniref:conjugative transposon protein TraM n=1 Tax=Mucilaginibacter sp. cycad4 TaxID=3342096 RepID=UPI002AAAFDB6|nr:conjugative transposon protein TraM [Mucilaginibacter gossypii]WPU99106.1 conjugative transposon protein TraM [Mucilaginibacter gossypii]
MKINLRQPKYVLPIILLPFLCLFFYVWQSGFSKPKTEVKEQAGLNGSVGGVSSDVRKRQLADKLDAYRNTFKEADGLTAVNVIPKENSSNPDYRPGNDELQKRTLDSLQQAMRSRFNGPSIVAQSDFSTESHDRQEAKAIVEMAKQQPGQPKKIVSEHTGEQEKDPMEIFKQQMVIMDSLTKENDPAFKAEKQKKEAADKVAKLKAIQPKLVVSKAGGPSSDFNTILPDKPNNFISATIDENVTGFAGSRLRLKLMEDIKAGNSLVKKGTYLFAQISGFSEQRVSLTISSILYEGKILPVKLELYDLDGLPGLYVPSSAFRDFTKDLGGNAVQGVTIDGSSGNSQFIMSSLDKVFQSTSSAIADLIRKNKARLKYNSFIYLIDADALQNTQKTY